MWEMSRYNLNNNNHNHHHNQNPGLGFNRDKLPAGDGGGGGSGSQLGNHHRHSISFQSGDMNVHSSGKFPVGVGGGGMLGINSKAPAVSTGSAGGGGGGGGGGGLPLNSVPGLNPDVELAVEWSPDEQAILEDGLVKYADEPNILKYIKISATLPEKTVRDVALRCRWMTKKENGKRRKSEEYYTGKKMKDKKEKPESSSKSSTPSAPPLNMGAYSLMMHHRDQNDRIQCEGIGGTTRHLLDENAQVFGHITANLATFKLQENIDLFCRTRNNIVAIINDMRAMPGIMSQMPPLPVSINEELANIILPNTAQTMMYCPPSTIYGKPDRRC